MSFCLPRVALILALGLAATACSSALEEPPDEIGEAPDAIQDGYLDDGDRAVVGIYNDEIGAICTGSLIAPNVVLTARHCVSDMANELDGQITCRSTRFTDTHLARRIFVTTDAEIGRYARFYGGSEVVLLPGEGTDAFCGNDQAILILDEPIPESEAVPLVPRVDVPLVEGEEYYAVGFGATNDASTGAGLRRRRDKLFIDCVADGCPSSLVKATEWVGDTGICEGDSGGPSLDMMHRVIGVTSRGAAGCEYPIYGYVYRWAEWIKETTVRAARAGGYKEPPWATGYPTDPAYSAEVGAACGQPEQCPANACLDGYCTRPCNGAAACPDGYSCNGEPGFCAKVSEPSADDEGSGSCSAKPRPDPTQPVPWVLAAASLGALASLRRLRGRERLG
ncbi:trypsin-like serine peptidase [Sorangium atrum]|uniref:Trypsin-like serine protease n=1 Tax=Sorangium atrum TaxID=2995308 RepID=A0ABT5CEZ9_9BACT|nr:trypsin-like serine protease [Sorangium aterium]MDC0683661.1 trypsin-like serine protease [Sorangium aterium]